MRPLCIYLYSCTCAGCSSPLQKSRIDGEQAPIRSTLVFSVNTTCSKVNVLWTYIIFVISMAHCSRLEKISLSVESESVSCVLCVTCSTCTRVHVKWFLNYLQFTWLDIYYYTHNSITTDFFGTLQGLTWFICKSEFHVEDVKYLRRGVHFFWSN